MDLSYRYRPAVRATRVGPRDLRMWFLVLTFQFSPRMASVAIVLLAWTVLAQAPDPAAESQRAQAMVAAGNFDEAIRIYQDLARRSPQNAVLLLNLCVAEYTGKRYREAA